MKLAVKERVSETKKDVKAIRREGDIPAVMYAPGQEAKKIIVNGAEFKAALREMKPGGLSTTVFSLDLGKGGLRAIVKDIQYNLTNYDVIHIDFEQLHDAVPVCVKVPVVCTGIMDCVGIKLGGFLRMVSRTVTVECLPEHIPVEFKVDVRELNIRQSKRLKDMVMPQGVKPLMSPEQVLVVIGKK
jgi:large subunit ribosomal protein L25